MTTRTSSSLAEAVGALFSPPNGVVVGWTRVEWDRQVPGRTPRSRHLTTGLAASWTLVETPNRVAAFTPVGSGAGTPHSSMEDYLAHAQAEMSTFAFPGQVLRSMHHSLYETSWIDLWEQRFAIHARLARNTGLHLDESAQLMGLALALDAAMSQEEKFLLRVADTAAARGYAEALHHARTIPQL